MKMNKPKTILALFGLAAIILVVSYFTLWSSEDPVEEGLKYKDFAIRRGTFHVEVTASGTVAPINRVEIKSKASGEIEDLPIEQGDFVNKGNLIVRLDQTNVKADLEQAQANLEIARAELTQSENNYKRKDQLFEKKMISQEEMDTATLQLAQARGQMISAQTALDQAQERFDETIVTAPLNGIILQKYVERGQIIASGISNVSGGTTIADIADMSKVNIVAGIDEIDVGKIRVGQEAEVTAEAYPDLKFDGKIVRIAPEARIEQNVTLFDVVIEVENGDSKLKSGMNADVTITIVEQDGVILAPTLALQTPRSGDEANIRIAMVRNGETYERRRVEVGASDFSETVVLSGLEENDILGVPMTSRLKEDNDRMEERIKASRSFGTTGSNTNTNSQTRPRSGN